MTRLTRKIPIFLTVFLALTFLIQTVYAEAWYSPSGYEESAWNSESSAYDENTVTGAYVGSLAQTTWTEYLTLTLAAPQISNKLRYYIYSSSSGWIKPVEIEVYDGASWTTVLNTSSPTWDAWTNVSYTQQTASKLRFRMYNTDPTDPHRVDVKETDILSLGAANTAPTVGEFQAPATVYANKYSFLNYTIQDVDGNTTFQNSTLTIVNGTSTFLWVNNTNVFSETSDPSNYWTLDAGNCLRTYVNATSFKLSFKLKAYWNFWEGTIDVNATVFDGDGANGTATSPALFTFEDDLIVQSATLNNYANPVSSITLDALLYYQGTATVPEDATGITGYIELAGVSKGSDASINSSGYFTVTFNSEAALGNHSYNVYAVADHNTEQNQTAWNWADTLTISITVTDNRIDINQNATIGVSAVFDSDSAVFNGSFLLNYTTYSHPAFSRHNYTVTSVSGGERSPIDQISTNDEDYVVWDSVTTSITVADNVIDVNTNASITVSGTYDYDGTPFDGTFTLNYTTYTHPVISRHNYTVFSLAGGAWGITAISSNDEDYVVWENVRIDSGGVSTTWQHVGENVLVYYVLKYEYLNTNVTDGNALLNGTGMAYNVVSQRWEQIVNEATLGNYSYHVTAVNTNFYGITVLNDATGYLNVTFYANLFLKTLDVANNTIIDTAVVYTLNGTYFSGSPPAGSSAGTAWIGSGGWIATTVIDGWVNQTGITNSTVQAYVLWHSLTVNSTFTITLAGDVYQNISCLMYNFTLSGTLRHAASNATITSHSFASDVLTVQFGGAVNTYVLCVSGPHPTYILNCTYNLTTQYTSYLELPHFANATISMGWPNWGGRYIPITDQRMTAVWWDAGIKLNMNFTGVGIGEVIIYCGASGCPPTTDGFVVTSYAPSLLFTGQYAFTSDPKNCWVAWTSTSTPPGGGGTSGQHVGDLSITVELLVDDEGSRQGDTINGTLHVTWTGDPIAYNMLYLSKAETEAVYKDWKLAFQEAFPITLSKSLADRSGSVYVNVTLTVPLNASLTTVHSIPYTFTFTLKDEGYRTATTVLPFILAQAAAVPISTYMMYVFLASIISVLAFGSLTVKKKREVKPF